MHHQSLGSNIYRERPRHLLTAQPVVEQQERVGPARRHASRSSAEPAPPDGHAHQDRPSRQPNHSENPGVRVYLFGDSRISHPPPVLHLALEFTDPGTRILISKEYKAIQCWVLDRSCAAGQKCAISSCGIGWDRQDEQDSRQAGLGGSGTLPS
jgi:hypothetical protein